MKGNAIDVVANMPSHSGSHQFVHMDILGFFTIIFSATLNKLGTSITLLLCLYYLRQSKRTVQQRMESFYDACRLQATAFGATMGNAALLSCIASMTWFARPFMLVGTFLAPLLFGYLTVLEQLRRRCVSFSAAT